MAHQTLFAITEIRNGVNDIFCYHTCIHAHATTIHLLDSYNNLIDKNSFKYIYQYTDIPEYIFHHM